MLGVEMGDSERETKGKTVSADWVAAEKYLRTCVSGTMQPATVRRVLGNVASTLSKASARYKRLVIDPGSDEKQLGGAAG